MPRSLVRLTSLGSGFATLSKALALAFAAARRSGTLLCACLLLATVHLGGALKPIDDYLAAQRAQMVERAPSGSLVVVAIDSRSLLAADEWPWPRERFATAIRNLREAGATLIGFDVDFGSRSNDADDSALRAAIDADTGSIVLPTFVQPGASEENTPLASLSRNAVLGSVNVRLDSDGRVRRYQRGYSHGDHHHAAMAAVLAGAPYGETAPFLIDYGIRTEELGTISFEDVYRGVFDADRVRGNTILIGATALELGDEFSTPIQPSMSGVLVHALAYESLVQRRALLEPNGALTLGLALLALLVLWPRPGPLNLRRLFIRQGAVLSAALLGPLALQAAAPISASLGLVLLTQAMCIALSVYLELNRRAAEIVRQREDHLSFVALHDPETELPNRRAMLEELQRRLDAQSATGVVVAVAFGIDRFPILRGAIGYGNANRLVQGLSSHIAECSARTQVFHISTSVLGIVLIAPSEEQARQLCADALNKLDTRITIDGQAIDVSVHAGSAIATAGAGAAENLLEQTTLALDQARLQGQSHVRYAAENVADPKFQLALISEVGKGLSRGEFSLLYQAKASVHGREIVGAEALMRWRHPTHGEISPEQFIQVAEETGSIDELTRWALGQATKDKAALLAQGVDQIVSINISGRLLADADFREFAIDAVRRANTRICFEITETAIIGDPQAAMSSIAAFRAAGIRVSVDDCGSGLSSLAYLKQIEADELKLDKSLIRDLTTNVRDRLILKSTIDLAHGLGMSVVAEGVEDEPTLAVLADLGCDTVQGYLIARPGALAHFARLCRSVEHAAAQAHQAC